MKYCNTMTKRGLQKLQEEEKRGKLIRLRAGGGGGSRVHFAA
jgi:hypothetical protein